MALGRIRGRKSTLVDKGTNPLPQEHGLRPLVSMVPREMRSFEAPGRAPLLGWRGVLWALALSIAGINAYFMLREPGRGNAAGSMFEDGAGGLMYPNASSLRASEFGEILLQREQVSGLRVPLRRPPSNFKIEHLAPLLVTPQSCGGAANQRLNLIHGIVTAIVLGGQVLLPAMAPLSGHGTAASGAARSLEQPRAIMVDFARLWDPLLLSDEVSEIASEYWCGRKQANPTAWALWCHRDGGSIRRAIPTNLHAGHLAFLEKEIARSGRSYRELQLQGGTFDLASMEALADRIHGTMGQDAAAHIHVALRCDEFPVPVIEDGGSWKLFWAVSDALQFEASIRELAATVVHGIQAQAPQGSGTKGLGAYHVLQVNVEADEHVLCSADARLDGQGGCLESSANLTNTLLAENVDATVPLYIASALSERELREFTRDGVAVLAPLFDAFSVITKGSIFRTMPTDWGHRERTKWAAVDFIVGAAAQTFIGNGRSVFGALTIASRFVHGRASWTYTRGLSVLEEDGTLRPKAPFGPDAFTKKPKWVFTLHEGATGLSRREVASLSAAVKSAAESSSMQPVCITTSGSKSSIAKFLASHGVRVLPVRPRWLDALRTQLRSIIAAANESGDVAFDRSGDVYLQADLDRLVARLLPLEIAVSGLLDPYVLYTRVDAAFPQEISWERLADAVARGSQESSAEETHARLVSVPRQKATGSLSLPRYLAAAPEAAVGLDSGVLLLHIAKLRESHALLMDFVLQRFGMDSASIEDERIVAAALAAAYNTGSSILDAAVAATGDVAAAQMPLWAPLPADMNAEAPTARNGEKTIVLRTSPLPHVDGGNPASARAPRASEAKGGGGEISHLRAPRSPWSIHNEQTLEIRSHRVNPIGMQFHAPWASGRAMRALAPLRPVTDGSTLLLYCVTEGDATALENLEFYLVVLERALRSLQASRSRPPFAPGGAYRHVFVLPPYLSLAKEDPKIARVLDTVLKLDVPGHELQALQLSATRAACTGSLLRMAGCATHGSGFDPTGFASVVLLDNRVAGPMLPKYWITAGYALWADAFTTRLSDDVRLVGTVLSCASNASLPVFQEGPLALDQGLFRLLLQEGMKSTLADATRLSLSAGFNMEALHGQPKGHDWQAWLRRNGEACPRSLQQRPRDQGLAVCEWPNWKARYPHLAQRPLEEAQERFLDDKERPQGDCIDLCDYGKYATHYTDLGDWAARAKEHFLLHGSLEGRDCFEDAALAYEAHAYETLFLPHTQGAKALAAANYMHWGRPQGDAAAAERQLVQSLSQSTDRILVVYAYFEKNEEYKENLQLFLDTCVAADALDGYVAPVDYVVVVNGEATVSFPTLRNLKVITRGNRCYDFGAWGTGLEHRSAHHKFFYCLNSSVRGPYLPAWFQSHWTQSMMALLTRKTTALIGTTLNCPDGVGRAVPHVMSMAMLFTLEGLEKGVEKGIFDCAETYHDALVREGSWSLVLLEARMGVDTMQAMYPHTDWIAWYVRHKMQPNGGLYRREDGFNQCDGIALDIFFKEKWYSGMTPHPMEFVFYKINRHIGLQNALALGRVREASVRGEVVTRRHALATAPLLPAGTGTPVTALQLFTSQTAAGLHIALFTHCLDLDGAPRLLYHMALLLIRQGHRVTVLSPFTGALRPLYEAAQATVIILPVNGNFWDLASGQNPPLDTILARHFPLGDTPDLLIFNTIMWTEYLTRRQELRPAYPRVAWLIHEGEISPTRRSPSGFWFGEQFREMQSREGVRRIAASVDGLVFVADATRALWSHADVGQFHTFRGFIPQAETERRAGVFGDQAAMQALRDKLTGGVGTKKILTAVGSICQRKQQALLVEALEAMGAEVFGDYVLLLVGAPSEAGGKGDLTYFNALRDYVEARRLSEKVRFVRFADDTLKYVAVADLHFSVSQNEAFPLNTLEAMLLGTPVMMTRAGGSEEELERPGPGGDGFLLPLATTAVELAAGIKENLAGLDLQTVLPAMGAAGRQTVQRRFTEVNAPARLHRLVQKFMGARPPTPARGSVCILVRTYAGQMTDPLFNLEAFLRSVQGLNYKAWTALVVQTDPAEMVGLYGLLSRLDDERLRVVQHPDLGAYHSGAFEITDEVVRQCPAGSDWLLATNGDNLYEAAFLDHLDLAFDVVAYDFYSRSTHILDPEIQGQGCRKYFEHAGSLCKKNLLKHWHTDLGANVLNLKRWRLEGRSFEALNEDDGSADGHTMESLVYYGWRVKHVGSEHGCLFSHAPNVHACVTAHADAIWVDDHQRCVVDAKEQQQLRSWGFHPFVSGSVRPETELVQGRCYDGPCPKHEEFIALAGSAPAVFFVDAVSAQLHPVADPEAQQCHGRNAYRTARKITRIAPECGEYPISGTPFDKGMCAQPAFAW